jgi:hypothetical protein
VGNKFFRNAISVVLEDFVNAVNRFEKALVVQRVVDSIQSRGGRFLKENTRQGGWYQLSIQQSKEKVSHAIRDAANLYEARKQKEKKAQATPQLRNAGESDDDNRKQADWGKDATMGGDESSLDYGVSSRGRGSLAMSSRSSSYTPTDYRGSSKRRGSVLETTDYYPHPKRRRTSSPTYFSSTMALSDQFLSTPSPSSQQQDQELDARAVLSSSLQQSPIVYPTSTSNVVSSGSLASTSRGVVLAKVPTSLRRSPIAPGGGDSILPPPQPHYVHYFTVYDPQQQSAVSASSPEEEPLPTTTTRYGYPLGWSGSTAHPHGHHSSVPILPPVYDERSYTQPHRYPSYPIVPPSTGGGHVYPPQLSPWSYPAPPVGPHRSWVADPYVETEGTHEESGAGGGSVESPSSPRQGDSRYS